MKLLIQLEELALLAIAITGMYLQSINLSWWVWILLFLSPDISMVGYFINTKMGAILYNIGHHKLTGTSVLGIGFFLHQDITLLSGLVLLGHSCFDRVFGYGLKYFDHFKHTNLGWIGGSEELKVKS